MAFSAHVILRSRLVSARTCRVLHKIKIFECGFANIDTNIGRCFSTAPKAMADRKFCQKHTWVLYDGKVGTIGISDHAQHALGEVVFAQLPDVGTTVKKDVECGALESVKAVSELYAPVSGKVVQKNEKAEKTPSLINKSCYDEGWVFKMELSQPEEIEKLLTEAAYTEFLKTLPKHH